MVQLLDRRRLEGIDLAPLRIDAGHDVLDRAVLARRVHRLEDEQRRVAVLGVQHVLQLGEALHPAAQPVLRPFLVLDPGAVPGVEVLEPELAAVDDPVGP